MYKLWIVALKRSAPLTTDAAVINASVLKPRGPRRADQGHARSAQGVRGRDRGALPEPSSPPCRAPEQSTLHGCSRPSAPTAAASARPTRWPASRASPRSWSGARNRPGSGGATSAPSSCARPSMSTPAGSVRHSAWAQAYYAARAGQGEVSSGGGQGPGLQVGPGHLEVLAGAGAI